MTNNPDPSDYPCRAQDWPSGQNGRGITYWGKESNPIEPFTLTAQSTNNDHKDMTFRFTKPRCYQTEDSCNVYFNAQPQSANSDVHLTIQFNDMTPSQDIWLSKTPGIDNRQSYEIIHTNLWRDGDAGLNHFKINNLSPYQVYISDILIVRVYQMCTLACDHTGQCNCSSNCDNINATQCPGNNCDFCRPKDTTPATYEVHHCSSGENTPADGTVESNNQRQDYPCNYDVCGGRSFTGRFLTYNDLTGLSTNDVDIQTGMDNKISFTFDWSNYSSHNYIAGDTCLFNLNQMFAHENGTCDNVPLDIYLSNSSGSIGTKIETIYLSPHAGYPQFPSIDLMKSPASSYYHDNGLNIITLVNTSDVPVYMTDDRGKNVYRIYQTRSVEAPSTPAFTQTPPATGELDYTIYFNVVSTDPQGDNITYQVDWGDGSGWQTYNYTGSGYASGTSRSFGRSWSSTGTKHIAIRAVDAAHNAFSGNLTQDIVIMAKPSVDDIFDGMGVVGFPFKLLVSASNPDPNDQSTLTYEIDWDDGNKTYPTGASGSLITPYPEHYYASASSQYNIYVKAQSHGLWSPQQGHSVYIHPQAITASAVNGATISPAGEVHVDYGDDSQTFTISVVDPQVYQISGVLVDGVSQGAISSHKFYNVTGWHTIQAVGTEIYPQPPAHYTLTVAASDQYGSVPVSVYVDSVAYEAGEDIDVVEGIHVISLDNPYYPEGSGTDWLWYWDLCPELAQSSIIINVISDLNTTAQYYLL